MQGYCGGTGEMGEKAANDAAIEDEDGREV